MRVLIVNRHRLDTAGGSETQCHEIAEELTRMGHTVTYAICHPSRNSYDVGYRTLPLRGAFSTAFRSALKQSTAEIVYWRYNKRSLLTGVLLSRARGAKFVFAVSHINDLRPFSAKPFYDDRISPTVRALRTLKRAGNSLIGAVNYSGSRLAHGVVFQHPGQIPSSFKRPHEVIYNSYPQLDVEPPAHECPYILWVANIKKSKNPECFIRLADELQAAEIEFWMVGGLQDSAYDTLLREAEASLPRFRYLGLQEPPAVNSLIKGAMLLAHTCDEEGFPNVFIQAWLQHKCVVSLFFDPGRLLATNQIGLYSGDFETFKTDVQRLVVDTELRESIGERAFQFAVEKCDREKNVKQLEGFLLELIANR